MAKLHDLKIEAEKATERLATHEARQPARAGTVERRLMHEGKDLPDATKREKAYKSWATMRNKLAKQNTASTNAYYAEKKAVAKAMGQPDNLGFAELNLFIDRLF